MSQPTHFVPVKFLLPAGRVLLGAVLFRTSLYRRVGFTLLYIMYSYKQAKSDPAAEKFDGLHLVEHYILEGKNPTAACEEVGRSLGINPETLRKQYYRSLKPKEKVHGNCILTEEEEQGVLGALLAFASVNKPLNVQQVTKIICELKNLSSPRAGEKTALRLLSRHSEELRLAKTKSLAPKRKGKDVLDSVEAFISIYKAILESGKYSPKNIILYDETGAAPGSDKSSTKRAVLAGAAKAQHVRGKTGKPLGVLPFATAAGEVIMIVYILQLSTYYGAVLGRNLIVEADRYPERDSFYSVYIFTDKGKIDGIAWHAIMKELQSRWELVHPGLHALLIGDSVGPHLNVETVSFLAERNMQTLYLVKNTTHWSQPWDDVPFALFKKKLTPAIDTKISLSRGTPHSVRTVAMSVVPSIVQEVFTPPIIQAATRNVGLYPFDEELIRRLAAENCDNPNFDSFAPDSVTMQVCRVVKDLITEDDVEVITSPVRTGQVYTGTQLLEEARLKEKRLEEERAQKELKRELKAEQKRQKLEEKLEKGKGILEARLQGKGAEVGQEWDDPEWVASNTCHLCHATNSRRLWTGSNCKRLWFCFVCTPSGRPLLAKHEAECSKCDKI